MAWLNFNDSLNNLKGQISSFANNVLADEEGKTLVDKSCNYFNYVIVNITFWSYYN